MREGGGLYSLFSFSFLLCACVSGVAVCAVWCGGCQHEWAARWVAATKLVTALTVDVVQFSLCGMHVCSVVWQWSMQERERERQCGGQHERVWWWWHCGEYMGSGVSGVAATQLVISISKQIRIQNIPHTDNKLDYGWMWETLCSADSDPVWPTWLCSTRHKTIV